MLKSKKEENLEELYKPQKIEVKLIPKEENKLTELAKNSNIIKVKVTDGNLTKKGIFSGPKFNCKLECDELKSSVNRSLDDLEWLKNQLHEKYPIIYIPPLPDKKVMTEFRSIERYIEKFFNALFRRKVLKTSSIVQGFLTLDGEQFEVFKKKINEDVYQISKNLDNLKCSKETLSYDFQRDQLYLPDKFVKKMEPTKSFYNSLDLMVSNISNDLNMLNRHMKELSNIFSQLLKSARDTDQSENAKRVFDNLKSIFNDYSNYYSKQSEFFQNDFKEFFHYSFLQINELARLNNQYQKKRNEYETLGCDYLNKREKLFNEKKYNKWELTKEDEAKLDTFKDNKEEALKHICKEMGDNVYSLKLQVACFSNLVLKQFNHINKYIGEQMKDYFTGLKEKNKEMLEEEPLISKLSKIFQE